uniref:Retrotransposon protein, putative, Ty1-copia subclass n=1 Tax=Oryza sativa subsp. japonica TaxID=39947 RepID=Q10IL6_ORYSJ|nr:retrotransposon protein, putative, Ty1-copia subclass [Oryza sativa Japonica Group]
MDFIVKRFQHFLSNSGYGKGRKDDDKGKRQSKRACFNCGEYSHFIADCPKSNEAKAKGGKKKLERAHVADAHMAEVWYSGDEEDPEVKPKPKPKDKVEGEGGVATVAFKSSSSSKERLFNNLSDDDDDSYHYSCFMAQGRKKRNLALEESLAKECAKNEQLANELNLANGSLASLRDVNETLQEKFANLDKTTNVDAMQALKKENERLGTLVKYGCMKTYHSKYALYKTITAHPNKDGHGLGFSGGSPMSKHVVAYSSGGSSWVVDSGCTNHMTGERSMFTSLDEEGGSRENIVFGDDGKGKVMGLGKIAISKNQSLSNVLLVNSLSYNLLSVSQLCKLGFNCLFTDVDVTVFRRDDSSIAFKRVLKGDLYLVDFDVDRVNPEACLIAKSSMGWLWHRRLALLGMRNLASLLKGEHILGLSNVSFEKDHVCSACQAGKQVGSLHPIKNIMTTTRPLELLHMDLFGPVAYVATEKIAFSRTLVY